MQIDLSRCRRLALVSLFAWFAPAASALAPAQAGGADQGGPAYAFEVLPFAQPSVVYDINNAGVAVVYVSAAAPTTHGESFLYDHGVITSVKVKGSVITEALGITEQGEVVGRYGMGMGQIFGFHQDAGGTVTTILYPGSHNTAIGDANAAGDLAGDYTTTTEPFPHGFTRVKGVFAPVVVPFPGAFAGGTAGQVYGINDQGTISGIYFDSTLAPHGYVRDAKGNFTAVSLGGSCTQLGKLNNRGKYVGVVGNGTCSDARVSFVSIPGGAVRLVPITGALAPGGLVSLNDNGDVAGFAYPLASSQAMIGWRL